MECPCKPQSSMWMLQLWYLGDVNLAASAQNTSEGVQPPAPLLCLLCYSWKTCPQGGGSRYLGQTVGPFHFSSFPVRIPAPFALEVKEETRFKLSLRWHLRLSWGLNNWRHWKSYGISPNSYEGTMGQTGCGWRRWPGQTLNQSLHLWSSVPCSLGLCY